MRAQLATVIGNLTERQIALTDIGTAAAIRGVLGEAAVRLASLFGIEIEADGWQEGMFLGAMAVLAFWFFGELGA